MSIRYNQNFKVWKLAMEFHASEPVPKRVGKLLWTGVGNDLDTAKRAPEVRSPNQVCKGTTVDIVLRIEINYSPAFCRPCSKEDCITEAALCESSRAPAHLQYG